MTNIHIVDPEPLSNEILVEKSLRPSFFDEFIGQKNLWKTSNCLLRLQTNEKKH